MLPIEGKWKFNSCLGAKFFFYKRREGNTHRGHWFFFFARRTNKGHTLEVKKKKIYTRSKRVLRRGVLQLRVLKLDFFGKRFTYKRTGPQYTRNTHTQDQKKRRQGEAIQDLFIRLLVEQRCAIRLVFERLRPACRHHALPPIAIVPQPHLLSLAKLSLPLLPDVDRASPVAFQTYWRAQ